MRSLMTKVNCIARAAVVVLALALAAGAPAHAATYTWIGGADGNWNAAANWTSSDGGTTYPNSADDVAVFTGDASPKTPGSFTVGGLRLTSGMLTFNTYGYKLKVSGENAVFDFADGTAVVINGGGGIVAAENLSTRLTIKGACTITNDVITGSTGEQFARVDVEKATIVSSRAAYATVFHLGAGASYTATTGGIDYSATCFDLDEGALVDMINNNYGNGVGAFSGRGTVRGYRNKLTLPNGPYTFSGTCENRDANNPCDWSLAPTDAENGYLIIGSANALSNCAVRLPNSEGRALRFAAGVGTFLIGNLACSASQSLYLADVNGDPVTVFARANASAFANTMASGPGDLYVANKDNNAIAYTGSTLFCQTGVLGALAGLFGQDAQNTTFGDGSSAEKNAKLDTLAGVAGYNIGQNMMSVRNYFKNVGDYRVGGLYGNGQFEFVSAGTATVGDFDVAAVAEDGHKPYVVLSGGDVKAEHAAAGGCIIQLSSGRTFSVAGGTIGSPTDLVQINAPGYGTGGYGTLVLDGTTLCAEKDSYAKRFEVRNGGVLAHYGRLSCPSSATESDPATILLDGGTLRGAWPATGYWDIQLPASESYASKFQVVVGEKGGRIEANRDDTVYSYQLYSAVAGEAGGDGGLTKAGLASLEIRQPFTFSGPFRVEEGGVNVNVSADAATLFGSGSLSLGNAWISFATGKSFGLATGSGAAFHYENCGSVIVNGGTAASVTVGSAGNAAFVRDAKGSVLNFCSRSASDALDGKGAKIAVAGTVGTTKAGILDQPVFALSRRDGGDRYSFDFLKPDGADGLVNASSLYKTTFDESGAVVSVAAAQTLASDAKVDGLRVTSATLTISDGATLSFTDEDAPAAILLANPSAAATIAGAGAIDFGSREGVIVVGLSGFDSYDFSGKISAKICGTGGLTLAGNMLCGLSSIRLGASNSYTGGTWINAVEAGAEADGCFGTGKVCVGTGVGESGSLRLAKNVTLPNEMRVVGNGKLVGTASNASSSGAIYKADSGTATLSGAIELAGDGAVVRVADAEGKVVFGGQVTGAALKIVGSGEVELGAANSYTGGTTVVGATVAMGDEKSLGAGAVALSAGAKLTLRPAAEAAVPFALSNAISGTGTIALLGAGKGRVMFGDVADDASLALDLGTARTRVVSSLAGFDAITTSREGATTLWVLNDAPGSFAGTVPSNVTVEYGEPRQKGLLFIVR